jgi:hypothetical protein
MGTLATSLLHLATAATSGAELPADFDAAAWLSEHKGQIAFVALIGLLAAAQMWEGRKPRPRV